MRARALLVSLAVALLPPLFVLVSHPIETGVQGRLQDQVQAAAWEAARDGDFEGTAAAYGVRLRVVDGSGSLTKDVDHETSAWFSVLGDVVLRFDAAPTPQELDDTLPPIAERAAALADHPPACHVSAAGKRLMCEAAARCSDGRVVHASMSSRRAIRALYDVRYQVVKLALFVLPLALVLGLYLGWRMVRPIEQLTARVRRGAPAGLMLDRQDEVGDLSRAFSALTAALVEKSQNNQAFVADLTHEMKNPIAAIRAVSEAIDDGSERYARLGRVLGDASQRLDALVTSLLELARAEAGMPGEARELLDLAELVRTIVAARPDSARIQLTTAAVEVAGAPNRLHSVVSNLIDNACAFGGEGVVRVRVRATAALAVLEVEDQGPGLPANVLPRVFERFFTTRGERHGTGLGLALVKAIVEAHGGTVSVGTADVGAVFTVSLPRAA